MLLPTIYAQTPPQTDNIPALLEQCNKNRRELNKHYYNYYCISTTTFRFYDEKGKLKKSQVEVAENFQGLTRNHNKVLKRNGKQLSEKSSQKEQNRVAAELEKDAPVQLNQRKFGIEYGSGLNFGTKHELFFSSFAFTRACEFFNLRHQQWQGRAVIALDFHPRSDYEPKEHGQKPITKLAGTVLIDEVDQVIMRLTAWSAQTDSSTWSQTQPLLLFEDQRLASGIWVPRHLQVLASKNPMLFNGNNFDWLADYSDYHQFSITASEPDLQQ